MISRLTASAACFAVLATATLAYAADTRGTVAASSAPATARTPGTASSHVTLPQVTVIGRRQAPR